MARPCPRRSQDNNAAGDTAESRDLEAVAALDLYPEYDEGLVERHRRQRLILAWMQDKRTGTLQ